jgi:hypothetical protein
MSRNTNKDFSAAVCTDCADRDNMICKVCRKHILSLDKCPEGYTISMIKQIERDYYNSIYANFQKNA